MAGGPLVGPERPGGGVDVGAGERLKVRRAAVGVQKHVRVRLRMDVLTVLKKKNEFILSLKYAKPARNIK